MTEKESITFFIGIYPVIIDKEDAEKVFAISWHINRSKGKGRDVGEPYARGRLKGQGGRKVYLHRLVMGFPPEWNEIDHKNHDTLDNRKHNLEIVSKKENQKRRRDRIHLYDNTSDTQTSGIETERESF